MNMNSQWIAYAMNWGISKEAYRFTTSSFGTDTTATGTLYSYLTFKIQKARTLENECGEEWSNN